jgi:hypothetical protein
MKIATALCTAIALILCCEDLAAQRRVEPYKPMDPGLGRLDRFDGLDRVGPIEAAPPPPPPLDQVPRYHCEYEQECGFDYRGNYYCRKKDLPTCVPE